MIRALTLGLLAVVATTSVMAADLIVEEPIAEVALAAYDWNGFYVGGQIGVMGVDVTTPDPDFVQPSGAGFLIGLHAGANAQMDSFVLGVEGDVEYSSFSATEFCANDDFDCSTNLDWQGSLRGRAGFAADSALFYVTAGLAAANFGGSTDDGTLFADSSVRFGWTAGAGIELGLSENLSARAEYRYSDYGSQDMEYDETYPDVGVTTQAIRVGLSWGM